ncbi:MAG TPA: alpha/beta fold hydrolase [Thiotrichaceae bacterium]|nr:alpha/beta fold hydrolase [Thiotrichaceae bacterium]
MGINSFGAGGANAHIILEEYNASKADSAECEDTPQLIVLSAKNPDRLQVYAQKLLVFLDNQFAKRVTAQKTVAAGRIEPENLRITIEQDLLSWVSELLQVRDTDISLEEELSEYGLDAVSLTALTRRINERYQLDITTALFSEHSSIAAVTQYLCDRYPKPAQIHDLLKETAFTEEDQTTALSLANMAYTLQLGREAMEERLAMVVSSLDEVKDKLTQYAQGQTDIERFYRGHVKTEQAEPLLDGREGEAFLKIIIQDQKLSKLAQLWVSGVEIDWTLLSPHHKPQRISLPTYPFARERYWLPESTTRLPNSASVATQLHPFIESNTSTLQEQRYTTALRGDEFFLADHVVGQQKTFPGVAYLEMAWVAGGMADKRAVQTLKDIVWVQPITVSDTPQRVHISFYPTETSQHIEFEVSTFDDAQQRQVHVQGQLTYQNQTTPNAETLDLEAIQKRCTESWDQAKCYHLFQAVGLSYGPGFQSIQTLYHNDTEALSRLVLPASLQSGFNDFVLHPTLMDGALQTVIGLMGSSISGTPLPFALAEISLIKPLPEQCYAYVTLTPESHDLNVKKFHLWLVDDRGQVLLKLKDFSVRAPRTIETTMYYQSVWEPQISPIQTQAQSISQVLLFEHDETRYQALQARLGCEVIWVKPAARYQALGNQVYAINPAQAADYRQLLASLAQQHQFPSHIIHFWSQAPFVTDSTVLANQIDLSLYSVFHLSQALFAQRLKAPIQLLYLYLEPDNAPQPQYAAFSGFAKTIRLENPKFIYKTVALSSLSELVDSVLTEIQTTDSVEIRYAHNQRWVKRWKAWEPVPESPIPETRLKEQGVYLVTGGAGGLGLIFAEYLAKQVKEAKLVLTGRSATLNEQAAAKIQTIKALGAEVLYIQADVSKRDDVEAMIAQTKAHFGQINGIIHSAGVIRDALLLNKTQDNMADVLAPKILGSVYLDEATKNDKLDFFVLFSSIVAAMGNIGQSDYAYANSFMDNFAQWREGLRAQEQRFGQTLSINWPLWQEGGMQVDSKKQAWLKQFMGMLPLSTEQGLKAFELCLNLAPVQMMVVEGEAEPIKKALNPVIQAPTLAATHNKQPINQNEPDKSPLNQSGPEPSQLQAKTEDYLKNLLSQELKLTSSTIQAHAPLEKYGIDSVMILSLTRKLESHFGTLSKTLFFEYKSIAELGQYLIKNHREQLIDKISDGVIPAQTETQTVTVLPELEQNNLARFTRSRFLNSTESSVSLTPETDIPEDDIAIIGVSGRYPMARDLTAFWNNLTAGIDCISDIPKERWDASQYEAVNHYPQWGGFIEGVDQFDPLFFNIYPREAEMMDPQERLFLETVWHTLEDAGYPKTSLKDKPVGVFVGVMWGEYQLFGALEKLKGQPMPTASYASIANRISYYFDFQGPSMAIDTMCSSSLTAIHLACESLKRGESEIAIAGGVNVSIHPKKYSLLGQHQFLSSDGRCRSFGEGGDGYVPGEGVGAVLLKPLHQARTDGDHIYAVIKGSSINHGGKTNGYTVPNPNAQASLISSALKKAKINPRSMSYVEAHGTGTSLGDPIEIRGLTKAYQEETVDTQYCAIGSVKSNIGHLESAAGIAALTKVLLQMKYKQLVPSLHSEHLNPNINFETSPFYVQHGLTEWKQPLIKENGEEIRYPRRAGISAFGAGGANAHLIVEEYEPPLQEVESPRQKDHIIVLSAKNEDRLQAYIKKIIDCLNSATVDGEGGSTLNEAKLHQPIQQPDLLLTDLAYTLQIGRDPLEERLAIVVDNIESLTEKLMQYAQGQTEIAHFYRGNLKTSKAHSALLIEGEAGQAFLNMLIEKQELTKLAQLWILGVEIDWQLLYPKPLKAQRIALPTYPFARERYWIPEKDISLNRHQDKVNQRMPSLPEEPTLNRLETKSTLQSVTKIHSLEAEIDELKQLFSEALKLDVIHLDEHSMLEQFGVDSLVLMDVIQKMSQRYQLKLKVSDLIGLNTIKDFAHYIINFQSSATHIKKGKPESESSLTLLGNHQPLIRKTAPSHWHEQLLENDNDVFSNDENVNLFQIKSSQGIHVEILSCGKGTPVVLLPPIDCLATAWLYQILELSQQFQVLVFHYPGYGNSEFHDEQSHFEAIGDSILDLLNLININQPFHLIGWSLGGLISQIMAKKYAPHIKSLTLVNTTAKLEEDDSIENAFKLAKLLREDFEHHLPQKRRSKREGSIDFIKATDNNQISLHYIHQVLQFDFRSQIASIQIPTLVIAGGEDHIAPPRYAEWIHNNIKGSRYEKLDKGGHYMPLQNAEYFNQQWFNFIQTI